VNELVFPVNFYIWIWLEEIQIVM